MLGGFKKKPASYERDDMVIAWASGHLLELQAPKEYDAKWNHWALGTLPIIPERFQHVPREGQGRAKDLLKGLVKLMKAKAKAFKKVNNSMEAKAAKSMKANAGKPMNAVGVDF